MAANIPLPQSPSPSTSSSPSLPKEPLTEERGTTEQQQQQPEITEKPQETAEQQQETAENHATHIEPSPPPPPSPYESTLHSIIQALLPIVSGQNTLLSLHHTLNELSQKPNTKLTEQTNQLLNSLNERFDQLDRLKVCDPSSNPISQLKLDQPPPPDPPDKIEIEEKASQEKQAAIQAMKTELETTQIKLKQEEEKRAKSISLLRAVRQKLVQTEKDKNALESELNEMNSNSSSKIKELQSDKRSLEDELSKLKITQEQQLSKLRHSYERENQSIRSQFEREKASTKSQFELDTITAKAAYERELTNRNQKIGQSEGRLREVSGERDRLFEQLQKRQAELEDTRAQHDELKGSVDELEHQLKESQNRIHVLCEELDHLQKLNSTQDSQQGGLQTMIQELEQTHRNKTQALELRISQLEKERMDVENELGESLRDRLAQIESLRNEARLKNIEYADSLNSTAQRNQEILKSDAERELLKNQLLSAIQTRDSQTDLIANLKQQLEELQEEWKKDKEELGKLRVEIEESQLREKTLKESNQKLIENEIKKVEEVKGLFLRGKIDQNPDLRREGVGYFANFSRKQSVHQATTLSPEKSSFALPSSSASSSTAATSPTRNVRRTSGVEVRVDRNESDLKQERTDSLNTLDHQLPPNNNHHQPQHENHHSLSVSDPSNPSSPTKQSSSSTITTLQNHTKDHNNGNVIVNDHQHYNDNEAELNFEYLRNTLLQFLEHKEMRPHLVRVLGVILHFTPQEIRRLASKV
ncbi:uncharacterized protein PGTG_16970 [Puccinia graminis f. sp. tritici CRL 75-36-700-3]|uniref:GRIP domain-containing protein n=1 Tax=Puccinia graminis f. sp. tritici (strain CRL 75-36-700-3 / race SCCL) TaxID=418459 RepID=E3L3I3_PUCGT|nr:uncharacterized protein PGTG_16970 [Puccinia graminis f. sp. tritici CRL 75-36-700-3]EFP91108.1 hypothetical protein PGTG_16970 [Puccinia graminis f. sp. tritici CRL 75-36-700-3]